MSQAETIAAVATASGRGGVGVIRVSGPNVKNIIHQLFEEEVPPRHATFKTFRDNNGIVIDSGLVLFFNAPASFTGEDVLELQGHGSPIVLDLLLERIVSLGARLAEPGEFTQRAFLNNKIDLAQAEAVADIIDARTKAAALSAQRSLEGEFSSWVNQLQHQLTELRMYVESAIDFSDEDIDFLQENALKQKIDVLRQSFKDLLSTAKQGALLREGLNVVLIGEPNAGKSSLMNALAQRETAIVTDIAGTTRDVLKEQIQIDGLPIHIIDTAGLRETDNVVEKEGVKRAKAALESADLVVLIENASKPPAENVRQQVPQNLPLIVVKNKIDLIQEQERVEQNDNGGEVYLSAKFGQGLCFLKDEIKRLAGFNDEEKNVFIARRRHLDALERARVHFTQGIEQLEEFQAGELFAEELRLAQNALSEITGRMTPDDLLGEIFSSFCIGK